MKRIMKYQQVENYIREEISSRRLKEGSQIPTEEQLCKRFGFSRMTVNKALIHLAEMGYIRRIAGKGSFVAPVHVMKQIGSQSSFTEDMKTAGSLAGSRLLCYQVLRGEEIPEIADQLHSDKHDLIHYFIRLRTGNEIPIALSYTYISAQVLPSVDVQSLNSSFYEYMEKMGLKRKNTFGKMQAVLPTEEQKKLLEIRDAALLKISHLTTTVKNEEEVPFEYIETFYVGDSYTYHFQNN